MAGTSRLSGHQEYFDGFGVKQSPLGFGYSEDWEVITKSTISGVSSIDFALDNSLYDEYEISVINLVPGTATANFEMRMSTDGGATFASGASDYEWAYAGHTSSPGTLGSGDGADTAIHIFANMGTTTNRTANARIRLHGMDSSDHKNIFTQGTYETNGGHRASVNQAGGYITSTSEVDAVQLRMDSGNMAGEFVLRGRRKVQATLSSQDDWVVITDDVDVGAATTHDYFWDDNVYDEIEITVSGAVTGTDIRDAFIRLSSDGSTFHSGATDYEYSVVNWSSSAVAGGEGSGGDAEGKIGVNMGTGTDEEQDWQLRIHAVSGSTRKTRVFVEGCGNIDNGTFQGWNSRIIDTNTNDRCQGIQFRLDGTATLAFDRVRIRGRRKTPTGVLKQDWEVIEQQIVTSGVATLDFTDIPVNEFDDFELVMTDVDTDTSANNMHLVFSQDNGATYESTDYDFTMLRMSSETTNVLDNATGDVHIQIGTNFGSNSARLIHATWKFSGLKAGPWPVVYGQMTTTNDSGNVRYYTGTGRNDTTGSDTAEITAFRIDLDLGNISAGIFTLRGRRTL